MSSKPTATPRTKPTKAPKAVATPWSQLVSPVPIRLPKTPKATLVLAGRKLDSAAAVAATAAELADDEQAAQHLAAYLKRERDRVAAAQKYQRDRANPQAMAKRAAWQSSNSEARREYMRRWRAANRERIRQAQREWAQRNYHANPEPHRAKSREWYAANREAVLARCKEKNDSKRQAREAAAQQAAAQQAAPAPQGQPASHPATPTQTKPRKTRHEQA